MIEQYKIKITPAHSTGLQSNYSLVLNDSILNEFKYKFTYVDVPVKLGDCPYTKIDRGDVKSQVQCKTSIQYFHIILS